MRLHATTGNAMRRILPVFALLLLAGCATHKVENQLTQTLDAYGAALRWGDFESALEFVDPTVLKAHPPTSLELARYKQVRVSAYEEQGVQTISETEVHQRVTIGLINVHTQVERSIADNQVWKYDAAQQRWWLESGLPQIVQ
jgi:hypothetical protein